MAGGTRLQQNIWLDEFLQGDADGNRGGRGGGGGGGKIKGAGGGGCNARGGNKRRPLADIGNLRGSALAPGAEGKNPVAGGNCKQVARGMHPMVRRSQAATGPQVPDLAGGPVVMQEGKRRRGTNAVAAEQRAVIAACARMMDSEMPEVKEKRPGSEDATCSGRDMDDVNYAEEVYAFYRKMERQFCVPPDYMQKYADINSKMRAILINWLIEVHWKFRLLPETLFLTVNLIDRYLAVAGVSRKELQLVGATAMFVAAKYEEILAPVVNDFVFISDKAYSREQFLATEKSMLNTLQYKLTVPTPYRFVLRFLAAAEAPDGQLELVSFFLLELCLMADFMLRFAPSLLAAAAVYTARCTLRLSPSWTAGLQDQSGYAETELLECGNMMVHLHRIAGAGDLIVVHKKYSSPDRNSVATLCPAFLPAAPTHTKESEDPLHQRPQQELQSSPILPPQCGDDINPGAF